MELEDILGPVVVVSSSEEPKDTPRVVRLRMCTKVFPQK